MTEIDAVRLNFTPESLIALDARLAFVLFGVALDLKMADFKGIVSAPRGTVIGILAHSVLLPAVAFALTLTVAGSAGCGTGSLSAPGG